MANVVKSWIASGLASWEKLGASVIFLKSGDTSVPRIFLKGKGEETLVFMSGLHLEETSGPKVLLDGKNFLQISDHLRNFDLIIYPVVNQYGLNFSEKSDSEVLRENKSGINYNDLWGMKSWKKPVENRLVEEDILAITKVRKIKFCISLHEDSTSPKKGYVWTNGVAPGERKKLAAGILKSVAKSVLWQSAEPFYEDKNKAKVENGFMIVGAKDKGAFENWMAEDLNVPTVLSEAPFGEDLKTRLKFQEVVIQASIEAF